MIHVSDECLGDLVLSGVANHPFVAWDNLMRRAAISGTPVGTDGAVDNSATWTTYDRWRPTGTGEVYMEALIAAEEGPVTFLAIEAHNLAKIGASVEWLHNPSPSGPTGWVSLGEIPAEHGVMAWRIMPTTARRWRLVVTVPVGMSANVGCIFIGAETILPLPMYQGFSPRIVPTEIALESNVSEGGNLIGTAVVRTGSTLSVNLDLMPADFVRGEFKPLMDWFNRARGIYFAWRPMKYPEDIHYGWRSGAVIRPENSGPKDRMSAVMSMRVFDG